jgi:hypothetical protein
MRGCSLLFAATALAASLARGQQPMVFRGFVIDDSARTPIAGAEVAVDGRVTRTDSSGRFRFSGVPQGEADVRVRSVGYREVLRVVVVPADSQEVSIGLARAAQTLSGVEISADAVPVSPFLRAFEDRRAMGIGRFLTRDQIEKVEYRRLSDVLRQLPGLGIVTAGGNKAYVASSRAGGCLASVYLDGVPLFRGTLGADPFSINDLSATQIEGVEYYAGPSLIPAQYNATSRTCAVLLLWTRMK